MEIEDSSLNGAIGAIQSRNYRLKKEELVCRVIKAIWDWDPPRYPLSINQPTTSVTRVPAAVAPVSYPSQVNRPAPSQQNPAPSQVASAPPRPATQQQQGYQANMDPAYVFALRCAD